MRSLEIFSQSSIEYYKLRIRSYTTTDYSPEKIHQMGLSEVARISKRMRDILTTLGYDENKTTGELMNELNENPDFLYADTSDRKEIVVNDYMEMVNEAIEVMTDYFHTMPKSEAVSYTLYRRFGYGTSAFSEGWALYAERLALEVGLAENPYDELGILQSELFRSVRLVVDTGMHYKRWTREEAMDYMKSITGMSDTEVRVEIERYIVWPGQALSYKVGMIKMLELREKAKQELGDQFNIKDFHSAVLDHGNPPLFIVEKMVDKMINDAKS